MDKVLSEHVWPKDIIKQSRTLGKVILSAMRRREAEVELHDSFDEIKRLKNRLEQENIYLRKTLSPKNTYEDIVGESPAIKAALGNIEKVAETNSTVLLTGDTGTGKELFARAIHNLSGRADRTMIMVSCAALPSTLVESELFGREKGAYTGAVSKQLGRFEIANGSTIFLDEIGELSPELQTKLLRVLEEGQFERLGSSRTMKVDVRVISATNKDLEKAVADGNFREDLFYRLNVFPITIPPLRDRREDIPLLVWSFVQGFEQSMGKSIDRIPKKTMDMLMEHSWPGNVRELRNVIERSMIITQGSTLEVELIARKAGPGRGSRELAEIEKEHIQRVLKETGWRIRGQNGAAAILGLKPTTLASRIKKLAIQREQDPTEKP